MRAAVVALAAVAAVVAAPESASATKSCGSVSGLVNEGTFRSTVKVRVPTKRTRCSTGRALARRVLAVGPAQVLRVRGRAWRMIASDSDQQPVRFTYKHRSHRVKLSITTKPA